MRSTSPSTTPREGSANAPDLSAATPEHPVALGPYDVMGLLGEGGMGRVYDAVQREHGIRVALKTLSRMAPESLLRFKSEFRQVAGISHPNLVQLYELGCHDDLWFFTMERVDGSDFLTGVRGPKSVASHDSETEVRQTTLTVAVDLTQPSAAGRSRRRTRRDEGTPALPPSIPGLRAALAQLVAGVHALHEAGLVHQDIKPSNVLVDRTGRVRVLDFGLVQAIPGPLVAPMEESPRGRTIRGTPLWMAPEQFFGAPVGEAADWYAVGLLLYEALTGLPAFPPATVSATFYARQHLPPPPPVDLVAGVPADLSALCAALLRSDPSERPTGGVLVEMVRADPGERSAIRARQLAPTRSDLVGREVEREQLRAAFRRSQDEGGAVVHVTGTSGMGKTALLRSFTDEAREGGALVLHGRCYERETVPYKAFDGIVDELAARLAARPQVEVAWDLPARIVALGRVFPVLATVPAIASRLDAAIEDSAAASMVELRRRAVLALGELLRRLGARQPVVLQIDDLHWADADSIDLLMGLLDAAPQGVLVAASFRREEAAQNPALGAYRDGRFAAGVTTIDLRALPASAAEVLASATLEALDLPPDSLAGAIAAESLGIPFFVEEMAHFAARHGSAGATGRARMQGVTLDTVLARRVQELPDVERALVEALSVANSPIPIAVWFDVAGVDGPGALRALWALRGSHFVKSTGAADDDRIELHHDRMRESVLSYMGREHIVDVHLRLGRSLAALDPSEQSPWLFDAVRHLGEAASRLQGVERIATARLHLLAGRRAREAAAFPLSFSCFQAGIALLDDRGWDDHYDLALALHSGAAESAYLSGAWDAVDAHIAVVQARARTLLDQLVVREVRIDAAIARRDYDAAVDAALSALRVLDVDLPDHPGPAEIGAAVAVATEALARVGAAGVLALPLASDARAVAAMRIMSRIGSATYFARPPLFPVLACRQVALSVEQGLSAATPYALSVYGIVLNTAGLLREAHGWGMVALDLLARIPDKSHEARTRHVIFDLVCVFTVPLAGTLDALHAVVALGQEHGDVEYAGYAAHAFVHNAFYAGRELSALRDEAVRLGASLRAYGQANALHVHLPFEQVIRCFLGETPDPRSLDDGTYSEEAALASAEADGSRSGQFLVRFCTGIASYCFGDPATASRAFAEIRPLLDGVPSSWHVPMFHQYAALAAWSLPEPERTAALEGAEESLSALRTFAQHGPENFAHRVDLVEAEKARASGDAETARAHFASAVAGAAANGFLNDEGLGHELAARFHRDRGEQAEADGHREAARAAYARWGARAKVARLGE